MVLLRFFRLILVFLAVILLTITFLPLGFVIDLLTLAYNFLDKQIQKLTDWLIIG